MAAVGADAEKGRPALSETSSHSATWYDEDPGSHLTHEVSEFFATYCGLEGEELLEHLRTNHARAWRVHPYPCVGLWGYLQPKLTKLPAWATVLQRALRGDVVLDLGCCMGSDLRGLAAAGVPTHNLYGADLEAEFWELGYDLFRDRDRFAAHFICADILSDDTPLRSLHGQVDVLYVGSFLHLFDWERQRKALVEMAKLTKPGSLVVGSQIGRTEGREVSSSKARGSRAMYLHDTETIKTLWNEVAEETASTWEFSARAVVMTGIPPKRRGGTWMSEHTRFLLFEATRVL